MDVKRLVLAIVLSVAVVMAWNYLALRMGWVEPTLPPEKPSIEQSSQEKEQSALPTSIAPEQIESALAGASLIVETPLYKAQLAVNGGVLRSFALKTFSIEAGKDEPFQFFSPRAVTFAPLGILLNAVPTWGVGIWKASHTSVVLNGTEQQTVILEGNINGTRITRELLFSANSYIIQERTLVHSATAEDIQIAYSLDATQLSINATYNTTKVAWSEHNAIVTEDNTRDLTNGKEIAGGVQWAGIMDNYFLSAIAPIQPASSMTRVKYEGDVFRVAVYAPKFMSSPSAPYSSSTYYYIGPKDTTILDEAPNNLRDSITYGFFAFLSRPLLLFLEFIYSFVHNYGVSIIILTLAIKLVFWPLSHKSYASMNKMKQMQPLVEEIREKYKDNKEEMNKAIMNLYKTYKVNPMGGCLPLLVQIPVFFALYEALLNSLSLRHAQFIEYFPYTHIIWLADLSAKDPLYITPIAMGVSMFIQQLITPSTGDPTQRKVMLVMPLVFTLFFLNFPSGLVLYWLSSNIISIIQQWLLLRKGRSA